MEKLQRKPKEIEEISSQSEVIPRKKSKVAIEDLNEEQLKLFQQLDLEKSTNDLLIDKNKLLYYYRLIEPFLPKTGRYDKSPEAIWLKLKEGLDAQGSPITLEDNEVVELLLERAEPILRQEIELLEGEHSANVKESVYKDMMADLKDGLISFKNSIQALELKDSFYSRQQKYLQAENKLAKDRIWEDISYEDKIKIRYKNFVFREFIDAKDSAQKLREKIAITESLLDKYRSEALNDASNQRSYQTYKRLQKTIKAYHALLKESPEMFLYEGLSNLAEMKHIIDAGGGIVETPYVKEKLALMDSFSSRPIFIHGELGSGKTELAKHAARKKYSKIYVESVWDKENPQPTNAKDLAEWEAKRKQAFEALVISGHKNLDATEMFGSKEMSPREAIPAERLAELIEKNVQRVRKERESNNEILGVAEEQDIRDIEKENHKNPVEVRTIMGSFYRAMKDGRPVILDELNAIPHTALIAINDLLTLKPGATVTPMLAGIKPFQVAEGFKVMATGNWKPEDGKMYFGRQGLDAAFLSRFAIVSYDYLPQRITGLSETTNIEDERKEKAESELFILMIAKLINKDLSLNLPEGSIKKLRALAGAARYIQNIFSEGEEGEIIFHSRLKDAPLPQKDILKENVLSLRHLLPILNNWRAEGFRHEIEEYILKDYISRSQVARETEKILLYKILQSIHGGILFQPEEGWPESEGPEGEKAVLDLLAEKRLYAYDNLTREQSPEGIIGIEDLSADQEFLSNKEVVELLFGTLPTRQYIDPSIFDQDIKGVEQEQTLDQDIINLIRQLELGEEVLAKEFNELDEQIKSPNIKLDKKDKDIIAKLTGLLNKDIKI